MLSESARKFNGVFVVLSLAVLAAVAVINAQGRGGGSQGIGVGVSDSPFVPGQVLVQFHAAAADADQADARARVGGAREELVIAAADRDDGKGDLELVMLPPGLTVAAAVARLRAHPAVEFAEPNWVYYHQAASNDPYYTGGQLWGMYGSTTSPANPYGIGAGTAWAANKTGSRSVYVGVIDEGFMYTHPELAGNTWTNANDPVDGIDNDGNGYVDDVHGWDFDRNDNTTYDGTQDDHGTHVAGTIGAAGGNAAGVAGVNWNVTLISGKFLGRNGGTTANAIKAVNYFTDLKKNRGVNVVATNNSWGGGGFSQSLSDAIDAGCNAGILFVAAAGNGGSDGVGDSNDTTPNYPSNYASPCVIAVAAITSTGARASFSNYGATTVDIGAPGQAIYSTLPGRKDTATYGSYSGTSMATPHVTGAAALYASLHPAATAAETKAAILAAALPTSSLAGKCVTGGRLNVSGF